MAAEKLLPSRAIPYCTISPEEYGLRVIVDAALINSAQSVPLGTLYKNSPIWMDRSFAAMGYADYVLSDVTPGDNSFNFWYLKNKTDDEANTPFRETTVKRNHPWPPMLLALVLVPDYTFLRTGKGYNSVENEVSEVVAPTYYVREVYIPGVNEGTKMIKREFFSPRKFDIPQTPVPVATSVSYDINGVRGSFPECLHPDIVIQSTRSGIAQVVAGVVSEVGGALEGQLFPATNFKEWAPYIVTDTQEQQSGGWYRVQWIAIPPEKPKTIVQ